MAPFAGIAFLWFIGVLRNRVGALEDQFFSTVFLGSGLLFVASLFASAAGFHRNDAYFQASEASREAPKVNFNLNDKKAAPTPAPAH